MQSLYRTKIFLVAATLALAAAVNLPAGQGVQRMLYTVPNNSFIENTSGDNVVTINDTSGSVATLQTLINNARSSNPGAIIVIHLLNGATYTVDNNSGSLTLGSQECLIGSGATVQAANSSVTNTLVVISSGATNVSIAGGVYNANGANVFGIFAPSSAARVNIDLVTVRNCGQDCIQLNGNGSGTFDNEMTVTRSDLSGSSGHSGVSTWNATQTTCVDNNCHRFQQRQRLLRRQQYLREQWHWHLRGWLRRHDRLGCPRQQFGGRYQFQRQREYLLRQRFRGWQCR
jgi:hypothetical protein